MNTSIYSKEYEKKIIDEDDIANIIKPGMRVFIAQGTGEPLVLVKALCRQADHFHNIKITVFPLPGINHALFAAQEYLDNWQIHAFFIIPELREAVFKGLAHYFPVHTSEIPIALSGQLRPDVSMIQVTPPDASGFCNMGVTIDYNRAAVDAASITIAQINSLMPVTCGDTGIHISEIDYFVKGDVELVQVPARKPNQVDLKLAENVVDLIPDGSTIQTGIGSMMDAILHGLKDKNDLGIHSGLLSDSMVELIEAGVVTGLNKNIDKRKVVAGILLGTNRLYEFCNKNPLVELYPTTYTHNRAKFSKLKNFVSINSMLEVDLTGQVNAESIKDKIIAGIGGQLDFMRIGRLSPGGKSILVMPSAVKGKSKIVHRFNQLVAVSDPRVDVDFVVTEYGVAALRYQSLSRRAMALAEISHPDFRDELKKAARSL